MFSQNVFSAKDVLASSSLCDSNTWDSQQSSQVNSYSQNSQLSSMDLFSQQKSSDPPRFDQYQRSQSQTTEDDPSTYYSKYVNNPPLFHGSSNNKNKVTTSVKDMIEEQKRNLSVREERDMLQTFINLLKDYTKEVNSTFENFRKYMEKSFDAMAKNIFDGVTSCNDNLKNLKEEIISSIETRDKESNEKDDLKNNVFEQTGTIKVLESKIEILEKQLNDAKVKESAYSDQKTKYNQLEEKYLQSVNNWDFNQGAFMDNTPPLSQHTDPLCNLLIPPPLRHEDSILNESGTYTFLPNQVPLLTTAGYAGLNLWEPGHPSNNRASDYYNPLEIMHPFQMDPAINPVTLYQTTAGNVVPSAASCLYSSSGSAPFEETSHLISRNSITYAQQQKNQNGIESNIPLHHNNFNNSGSSSQGCLIVSRRSSKRPKQSPVAMVRPQIRCNDSHDDIFLSGVKEGCRDTQNQQNTMNSALPLCNLEQRATLERKLRANEIIKNAPYQVESFSKRMTGDSRDRIPQEISKQGKSFRREESVKRKRSLVSMLGIASDDLEVQEITNSIKAQQRKLAKRIRSSS